MSTEQHNPDTSEPIVLLIDDSEFVHRLLKARLKTEAIELAYASNGKIGIERAVEPSRTCSNFRPVRMMGLVAVFMLYCPKIVPNYKPTSLVSSSHPAGLRGGKQRIY